MKRIFVYVENFDQKQKQQGLDATEQRELELQLLMDPSQGAVIAGTGGLRKMRFSPESDNQGKSGAYRIIYLDIQTSSHTISLLIYAKNQQETLKSDQKKILKQFVDQLKNLYTSERMDEQ